MAMAGFRVQRYQMDQLLLITIKELQSTALPLNLFFRQIPLHNATQLYNPVQSYFTYQHAL